MVSGIVTRDGWRLDYGAGVGATAIKGAIKGLLEKGLIDVQHNQSPQRGHEPTTYRLRLRATPDPPLVINRPRGRPESDQGERPQNGQALGWNVPPQETGQETESQEDPTPLLSSSEPPRYSAFLAAVVLDHAGELGAAGRGPAGVGEILSLWQASGLDESAFATRLHEARAAARKAQRPGVDKWRLYLDAVRAGSR